MKDERVQVCKTWWYKLAEDKNWFDNVVTMDVLLRPNQEAFTNLSGKRRTWVFIGSKINGEGGGDHFFQ